VWQELSRGLMAQRPSRMFEVLRDCGALKRLLPEVERLWGVPQPPEHHPEIDTGVHLMMVLDQCARLEMPLPVRWACLGHDLGKGNTAPAAWPRHIGHEGRSAKLVRALGERLRVPTDCRELAEVVAREHGHIHGSGSLSAMALVRLFERCDALRRPERFTQVLQACECDARGRTGREDRPYAPATRLPPLLAAARGIDTATAAADAVAQGKRGPEIGATVMAARAQAIAAALA
jgi:tRNA nucleotidyltransferase (CCA-adding enzyme)